MMYIIIMIIKKNLIPLKTHPSLQPPKHLYANIISKVDASMVSLVRRMEIARLLIQKRAKDSSEMGPRAEEGANSKIAGSSTLMCANHH